MIFWQHQLVPSVGNDFVDFYVIANASRTKSCMVLTQSMATTNNVQEDEPRPTALERQVQTRSEERRVGKECW